MGPVHTLSRAVATTSQKHVNKQKERCVQWELSGSCCDL